MKDKANIRKHFTQVIKAVYKFEHLYLFQRSSMEVQNMHTAVRDTRCFNAWCFCLNMSSDKYF